MRRLSLRWMLLLPVLATIIVGFLAFAFAVDISERAHRISELDAELARAELAAITPPSPGAGGEPSDGSVPGDGPAPGAGPAPSAAPPATGESAVAQELLPIQFTVRSDGTLAENQGAAIPFSVETIASFVTIDSPTTVSIDDYRVLVSPSATDIVQVTALSLDGYNAAIASLRTTLVAGGLTIALLEVAMAWFLARQLARPLAVVAGGVTRIADGALDTALTPVGGSREVSELATDIDRMVNRLRDALAEREQSAVDATRARNDMRRLLADVAHEIRTPLTALKGYSDLYSKEMLTAPGALDRAMSRVGDESIRLNVLVNSMLQLARDGATTAPEHVAVDLATVTQNVFDDLRVVFPERDFATDLHALRTAPVMGNAAQLHQALLNLVANACRHTPSSTPIEIVSSSTSREIIMSVVDHGPGIPDDEREKIFQPFYRSDPSRVRSSNDGAGLGLAVTLEIAIQHGGTVALHTTAGGGATFELRLPLAEEPSAYI
ncbi:HAMP domain-containing histidine kinase [Salinibacterium sp. SWN139]|uniref:sensor histidine kinase n=1 Tax=Salinibacterium sp. SWN139 TaxID=2792055 RepID=UPI0018CF6FA8|nr:HAMP domain-containing sensor histidine kinase [Salinibacterium sp. SWN139]MBH0055099.1 HAMP domain-containing histidine kinase [Salinibacterium sp. SWN139]